MLPISVFIIAKNEADRISHTLKSVVGIFDEVIVIDSGSQDNTVQICEEFGVKVVFNKWQGYGQQKVFSESLCKNKWLLNLDADEELSEKLQNEIKELFQNSQPKYDAYRLNIKLQSRFASKPSLFAPSNSPIRLYNKQVAGFKNNSVHDSVIFKGKQGSIRKLKGTVNHRSFRGYAHAVAKINNYTTMQAENMVAKNKKISNIRLIFEPPLTFCKAYFLRRYIFLGVDGIFESFLYAFSRTLKIAKTKELYKEKSK